MSIQALRAFPLVLVLILSCRSRNTQMEQKLSETFGNKKVPGSVSGGSATFLEMEEFRADSTNRLNYSPMTPCDLFVWAESAWPSLPVDPIDLAQSYRDKSAASGSAPQSYESLDEAPKGIKTKRFVSLDEAIKMINSYLIFKDPDPQLQDFVQTSWQQAIINHGRGWAGSKGYTGINIEKSTGSKFSDEALQECRNYAANIQGGVGNTAMHMVGDYLAHVLVQDFLKANPDATYGLKNQEWLKALLASDAAKNIPYLSVVFALPAPVAISSATVPVEYDLKKDPRRFVVPTISYRTFKANWGDPSQKKMKQDLTIKALCYFKKNPQLDYRNRKIPADWPTGIVKTKSNWIGSWDSNGVRAFANYEDVELDEGAPDCKGLDFEKPF